MKDVPRLLLAAALAAGVVFPAAAQQAAAPAATAPAAGLTEGEVRRVDKSTGKISLRHEEIKSLEMPPMTMVFAVKDPAVLDMVKVGDRVRFTADRLAGVYTITSLEVLK